MGIIPSTFRMDVGFWCSHNGVVTITEGDIFPRYWIVTPHCNTSARSVLSPTQCTFYSMAYFDNDLKELFEMHQKSSQSRGGLLEINCELFWSFLLGLGVLECFFMYQVCTGDHNVFILPRKEFSNITIGYVLDHLGFLSYQFQVPQYFHQLHICKIMSLARIPNITIQRQR